MNKNLRSPELQNLVRVKIDDLSGAALNYACMEAHGKSPVNSVPEDNLELMTAELIGLERPSAGQTPPQWRALTK